MSNLSLAAVMAADQGLDERRALIFERAYALACRDEHLVLRESGSEGAHAVFDRNRGDMRVIVDLTRHDEGDVEEALDLKIIELDCLVFHVSGRRARAERGRGKVTVTLQKDTSSYWEAILSSI